MSRNLQKTVLLICAGLSGYFAYHAVVGRYGLEARATLIERSKALEHEIARLEAVRSRLAREVALLGAEPPDHDLVEELAGRMLAMVRPGDIVLLPAE